MKLRPLGRSGLEVAPLAFGGNVFGWTVEPGVAFRLLDAFVEAGLILVDTADVYSKWAPGNKGGESETIIGQWLAQGGGRRERVLVATKVGMEMPAGKGLSRRHIVASVEGSLKRLQTDRIDLYQSHNEDPETPLEETLEAYAELIRSGKVRAIGCSNHAADTLSKALAVSRERGIPRYESLQPMYNLYARADFEAKLGPLCEAESVGVISYYPLASGFLTGKYRGEADLAQSPRGNAVKKYLNDRGFRILAALDEVAKRLHAKPSQVAIAWLIAQPAVTAPIASATTPAQLRELIGAVDLSLDADALAVLDRAST
jgi:aryl-alcohol dehydrogenase-like predicted oxidoreductase